MGCVQVRAGVRGYVVCDSGGGGGRIIDVDVDVDVDASATGVLEAQAQATFGVGGGSGPGMFRIYFLARFRGSPGTTTQAGGNTKAHAPRPLGGGHWPSVPISDLTYRHHVRFPFLPFSLLHLHLHRATIHPPFARSAFRTPSTLLSAMVASLRRGAHRSARI